MQPKAAILDVGNCSPDHAMIRRMLTSYFDVDVDQVMFVDEALERMRERRYQLVLVNRLIFEDGSEGIELIRRTQDQAGLRDVPIMMISNYAEAQAKAVKAGAVRGFGKDAIDEWGPIQLLSQYLPRKANSGGQCG